MKDGMKNERLISLAKEFEAFGLEFIRKHQITHEEYRIVVGTIIDSIKAGEESLFFDVFFEAEATDVSNHESESSTQALEGPFYLPGAPRLTRPYKMPMRPDEPGDILFFNGMVKDTDGNPIAGAELDMWHSTNDGLYSNIFPEVPEWDLRGIFTSDEAGAFEVQSITPVPYEIPKFGPTGRALTALGRHCWRPAHIHLKVRADGFEEITSQVYFKGGQWLDDDAVNGVREGLVAELVRHEDPDDIAARGLTQPFFEVTYDYVLNRA